MSLFTLGAIAACEPDGADVDEPDQVDVDIADYAVQTPEGTSKVVVCHVQGSDPHEIEVGFDSVRSHLAHGDFLGPCDPPQ